MVTVFLFSTLSVASRTMSAIFPSPSTSFGNSIDQFALAVVCGADDEVTGTLVLPTLHVSVFVPEPPLAGLPSSFKSFHVPRRVNLLSLRSVSFMVPLLSRFATRRFGASVSFTRLTKFETEVVCPAMSSATMLSFPSGGLLITAFHPFISYLFEMLEYCCQFAES